MEITVMETAIIVGLTILVSSFIVWVLMRILNHIEVHSSTPRKSDHKPQEPRLVRGWYTCGDSGLHFHVGEDEYSFKDDNEIQIVDLDGKVVWVKCEDDANGDKVWDGTTTEKDDISLELVRDNHGYLYVADTSIKEDKISSIKEDKISLVLVADYHGYLYIANTNIGDIKKVHSKTGDIIWCANKKINGIHSMTIDQNNHLYVATINGSVYTINESGTVISAFYNMY